MLLHFLLVFVLPFISLLAGIASLYIDPHAEPRKKWLLVGLMLISAAGSIVGSYKDDQEKTDSSHRIAQLIDTTQSLATVTNHIREDTQALTENLLPKLGLPAATAQVLRQSLSAQTAREAVLPLVKNQSSGKITVIYYPKNVDGPVVINALKEGGFQVETRHGNPANADVPTNAVWVGDAVTLEQAKFVAFTLVRAGVGLASIRRFRDGSGPKMNLVEVGTDQSLIGSPPLTVETISALTQIQTERSAVNESAN